MAEVQTFDSLDVQACTIGGVDHDWRPYEYLHLNRPHMSWRCTWCHAVGLPYHHAEPHRSRDGVTWPLGGDRHA